MNHTHFFYWWWNYERAREAKDVLHSEPRDMNVHIFFVVCCCGCRNDNNKKPALSLTLSPYVRVCECLWHQATRLNFYFALSLQRMLIIMIYRENIFFSLIFHIPHLPGFFIQLLVWHRSMHNDFFYTKTQISILNSLFLLPWLVAAAADDAREWKRKRMR